MEKEIRKSENSKQYPKDHFFTQWTLIFVAIFAVFGIPLSFATRNHAFFTFGPPLGILFGAVIGYSIETKYEKEGRIRPLKKEEKKKRIKLGITSGIIYLIVFLIGDLFFF